MLCLYPILKRNATNIIELIKLYTSVYYETYYLDIVKFYDGRRFKKTGRCEYTISKLAIPTYYILFIVNKPAGSRKRYPLLYRHDAIYDENDLYISESMDFSNIVFLSNCGFMNMNKCEKITHTAIVNLLNQFNEEIISDSGKMKTMSQFNMITTIKGQIDKYIEIEENIIKHILKIMRPMRIYWEFRGIHYIGDHHTQYINGEPTEVERSYLWQFEQYSNNTVEHMGKKGNIKACDHLIDCVILSYNYDKAYKFKIYNDLFHKLETRVKNVDIVDMYAYNRNKDQIESHVEDLFRKGISKLDSLLLGNDQV